MVQDEGTKMFLKARKVSLSEKKLKQVKSKQTLSMG